MSTAVAKIGKQVPDLTRRPLREQRVSVFAPPVSIATRIARIFRGLVFPTIVTAGVLLIVGVIGFAYFYNFYSAMVDHRIKTGFWFSRGGVYAAPYRLKTGRRASMDSVTDSLRRGGYVEGAEPDQIWNGSFVVDGNRLRVTSNTGYNRQARVTEIVFSNNKIASITEDGRAADEFLIEPEMLTGRTETKRSGNSVLKYEDIPTDLRNAILIAEDQRFFSHHGLDPRGIARAFVQNFNEGEVKQGGSTITQQLAKNTFLSPERSYRRKFAEAFLAIALENKMSKEQIFALYCNEIYLGQYGSIGVHGVEQAAKAYFGKDLKDISLNDAAAIAAMIKNPKRFAPYKDEAPIVQRREWIVQKMAENGMVNIEQAQAAIGKPVSLAPPSSKENAIAPYFVDAATRQIEQIYSGDYQNTNFNTRVYTTIDTQLQKIAESAVAGHLSKLQRTYTKKGGNLQAALVAIDPQNGHVLAMVGGRDYAASQFNRATDALRQPGSAFKPFVYAAALERGYTPISVFDDSPTEFTLSDGKSYTPANYGNSYASHNISMKTALAKSSNVVAIKTALQAGLRNVAETAEEFGFNDIQPYPSMPLGTVEATPLQLAAAYATFANGGRKVEPTFIDQIVSGEEKALYQSRASENQIITEQTAYMMTDMLKAVVERGTAHKAKGALGENVFAGKTGSSKDGWFVGYTPHLVTVTWVGFDETEDIGATGGEVALPIWTEFMRAVVRTRPEFGGEEFPMPKGLTTVVVDPETGMLADSYCPNREQVVVPVRSAPLVKCLLHQPKKDPLAIDIGETLEGEASVIEIEPAEVAEPEVEAYEMPEAGDSERYRNSSTEKKRNEPDRQLDETYYLEYSRTPAAKRDNRRIDP